MLMQLVQIVRNIGINKSGVRGFQVLNFGEEKSEDRLTLEDSLISIPVLIEGVRGILQT